MAGLGSLFKSTVIKIFLTISTTVFVKTSSDANDLSQENCASVDLIRFRDCSKNKIYKIFSSFFTPPDVSIQRY